MIRGSLCRFLQRQVIQRREPDFVIHDQAGPYLRRWHLVRRNRWMNIYLHEFVGDDDARALHDHPWASLSWLLSGAIRERYLSKSGSEEVRALFPGALVFRRASFAHRLELGSSKALTLFVTGPVQREWGFLCPGGWRPWREFVSGKDKGAVGRGCE